MLIDEISLANDSVLERLNSVFEYDRTLVLTEKSQQETLKIVAADKFNIVATMNPSGDFGKKELSPALRNRMTEIWVDSYFNQEELLNIYADQSLIKQAVPDSVDLFFIIANICNDQLGPLLAKADVEAISLGIFNMIGFVHFVMSTRYFAM